MRLRSFVARYKEALAEKWTTSDPQMTQILLIVMHDAYTHLPHKVMIAPVNLRDLRIS